MDFLLPFFILQWNAQSLVAHGQELKHYIYNSTVKPDVICIQESWLKINLNFKLNNYSIIRKDRLEGRGGGVCIFIRNNISYRIKEHINLNNIEYNHVEINIMNLNINIINIYNPGKKICKNLYNILFSQKNVIICGDFNSSNKIWGSNNTNTNGKIIQELVEENDLFMFNDGTGTHIAQNGNKTCIDLTFSSIRFSDIGNWIVQEDTLGSDHQIIELHLFQINKNIEKNDCRMWNYKKAKWTLFQENLDKLISSQTIDFDDNLDVNSYNEMLTNIIIKMANKYIPKIKNLSKNPVPYWNDDCNIAIKERKKAKRKVIRSKLPQDYIEYKKKKAIAQKIIKQSKKEYWQNYCNSLNNNSNLNQIWRTVKKIRNGQNDNNGSIPTIIRDNIEFKDDQQKAEAFAKTFELVSKNSNYGKEFIKNKNLFIKENINILNKQPIQNDILDENFNIYELLHVLQSTKNSAPGKDNVTYEILKHFSMNSLQHVLTFYNYIWCHGQIPDQWKLSTVIPILKQGKNKHDTLSYRPISLTSNLGKIMERLITNRLDWYIEKNQLFNPFQSGFRKNRNTQDHLFRLQNDIQNALNINSKTVTIFLDIEKAYDMLWREGLLYKILQINITGKMFNWVQDFLKNRLFQVKIKNTFSNIHSLENGTPQGSCVSPILFLIMVNDLKISNPDIQISLFADDIALWISGPDIDTNISIIQKALYDIEKWSKKWGFKISIPKTKAIIFSKHRLRKPPTILKIYNQNIEYVKKFKFLGLIFDSKLNWTHHIDYVEENCNRRINLLRCVSGTKWGANRKNLYNLYTALIRSKIDYGSEFYHNTTQQCKNKLDLIQYKCLRICSGALRSTPIPILLITNKEIPLEIRRKELHAKFLYKIYNKDIFKKHTNICWQNYYANQNPKKETLVNATINIISRGKIVDYFDNYASHIDYLKMPPWFIPDIHVNLELVNKVDKMNFPSKTKVITENHISSYNGYLKIFTDGSKQKNNRTASAVYIPEFNIKISKRISNECSIFSAELTAILLAMNWVREIKPLKTVIFSDSLSSLLSIKNVRHHINTNAIIKELALIFTEVYNNKITVVLSWIPSHINIKENDKVDNIAKDSCNFENIQLKVPLNKCEINNEIHFKYNSIWKAQYNMNNKGKFFKSIEPDFEKIYPISLKNRHMETTIYRLRSGHNLLNSHLHKIGLHNSGLCDFCEELETVKHYLLDCLKYQQYQEDIVNFAVKNHIKLSVDCILKNKKFFPTIYNYVINTQRKI